MFESKKVEIKMVSKEIIREYDKDGKLIRERTVINDGGTSQQGAEECLKKAEERLDKMTGRMDNVFKGMEDLFKDLF